MLPILEITNIFNESFKIQVLLIIIITLLAIGASLI